MPQRPCRKLNRVAYFACIAVSGEISRLGLDVHRRRVPCDSDDDLEADISMSEHVDTRWTFWQLQGKGSCAHHMRMATFAFLQSHFSFHITTCMTAVILSGDAYRVN
jgi:hypothetical protein